MTVHASLNAAEGERRYSSAILYVGGKDRMIFTGKHYNDLRKKYVIMCVSPM